MRAPSEIILRPLISEKSYAAMQLGKYTFVVHPSVNTMNVIGKERRRRTSSGFDPGRKKAIVTLAPGQSIKDLFETTSG
jgi:large subunit ribosomal protein L23